MRNFAFGRAQTISQKPRAAARLVAEAMLAPDGGARSGDVQVVKAGGIDLIDLMKEGLLAPALVTSLSAVPGPRRNRDDARRAACGIGAMVTLARLASDPVIRERYPALAAAAGESASPQIRAVATLGGNLLQRPRCWYFRLGRVPLSAQGRRPLLRHLRREPVSRHFRQPRSARSSIRRPPPPRLSRSARRSNLPTPTAERAA